MAGIEFTPNLEDPVVQNTIKNILASVGDVAPEDIVLGAELLTLERQRHRLAKKKTGKDRNQERFRQMKSDIVGMLRGELEQRREKVRQFYERKREYEEA